MIDRFGSFFIEEYVQDNKRALPFKIECYMIHKKKRINDFESIVDVVERAKIEYIREHKLNEILYESNETNNTTTKGSS